MSLFSINKIHIKNFKLFEDIPQPIILGGSTLTVLDGPNGFGKTSIFDVIELVLTGKLNRIKKSDARTKYNELLFKNDSSVESILKIEFVKKESKENFTILKTIPANLMTEKNSPDNFDIFETYLLDNFNDLPSQDNLVVTELREVIFEKFGVDITNIFNLVYYIEQEDNKYLLRMNETERLTQISLLFNTDREEAELKRYNEIKNTLLKKKKKLSSDITILSSDIDGLTKQLNKTEEGKVEYFELLPHFSPLFEWDRKHLKSLNFETKERYIQELNKISEFIVNFESFEAKEFNTKLLSFTNNEQLLENFIILKSNSNNADEIIELYEDQLNAYILATQLSKEQFLVEWKDFEFDKLYDFWTSHKPTLFTSETKEKIQNKIKELREAEKNSSIFSESIRELINIRDSFIRKYKSTLDDTHKHDSSVECPLCGGFWDSYSQLISNFESKKNYFESLLDDTSNLINDSLNNLYDTVISQVYQDSLNYFKEENDKIISTQYYNQIKDIPKDKNQIKVFEDWLNKNDIFFRELIPLKNNYIENDEILLIKQKLKSTNESNLKTIKNTTIDIDLELFNSIYKQYFKMDSRLVDKCNTEAIDKKIEYIKTCYYNSIFIEKEKLISELEEYKEKELIYEQLLDGTKKVIKVYDTNIKKYWKQIMKDIEIVFYIYSAKILQSHQRGSGIFMKESKSRIIRFISHPEKDHDVSNFMSSGQLSGVILALTLTLNKVYGNKGLSSLLIDDPLQTMDDINISSFIELLRNDFREKQIILSTHEENISNFLKYKFDVFNLRSQSLNLKNDLYLK
ncbi:AAA family ATPase [Jeotgalibacillus terrae]|uniref:Nuclease SbcCD subunit C n=1 Tax=Jeotgalibacillus terrae TaxID=587735 RepID=A0ABW5ZPY9_9BACL|nr:AAA family ATPase [Jeotgalibacillus terrae]MBM7581124.1 DNA repair exonuclease SbcCD ATPase subunit [Jeotgalibacillus terrae]